jgi:putative peptidoglycan lipid II flippase
MGVVAWIGAAQVDWLGMRHQLVLRAGALFLLISLCGATYFSALLLMGFRLRDFKRRAK